MRKYVNSDQQKVAKAPQSANSAEYQFNKLYTEGNIKTVAQRPLSAAPQWAPPRGSFNPKFTHKDIADYTEQMSMKLIENMRGIHNQGLLAVTSFVELDSSLKTTNLLGNQLAESFMSQMQEFGVSVVDFKTTGNIRVTQQGDLAFSRDFDDLKEQQNIDYILSGTLSYTDKGVVVNARVVGLTDKVMVSSARGFIPHFVIRSLYPSEMIK